MSEEPIYVDATYPADLRFRENHPVHVVGMTLQEAVTAFHQKTPEEQSRATIVVRGGPLNGRVFKLEEIKLLHYNPKSV